MKLRQIAAAAVCAAAAANSFILPAAAEQEADPMNIVIDGNNANTLENMLYRGVGMVSGNNSSRLLLDYKAENPEAYWEIMNYMFGKQGLEIAHLKLEMGSDVNSSSGTEPSVKRTENEPADVTRGAGYQLAADAKSINPDLGQQLRGCVCGTLQVVQGNAGRGVRHLRHSVRLCFCNPERARS